MSPTTGPSGGFSLFPSPSVSKPPSRKTTPRPHGGNTSQSSQGRGPSLDVSPHSGLHTSEELAEYVIDGTPPTATGRRMVSNNAWYQSQPNPPMQKAASPPPGVPPKDVPSRTGTALSGTSTLTRNPSEGSPASKQTLGDPQTSLAERETAIRSIFPQYDYSLPFDQQNYYPTQASPTHIPKTVISRQSHVPQQIEPRSPPVRSPIRSPMSVGSSQQWARRQHEPPVVPSVSTTEELRDYWKAANGWKAPSTEGRTFCMRLVPEKDTPVYMLLSRTLQPFYHMRIDPTSASAYVTLSRHDPSKPCKEKEPSGASQNTPGLLGALREADGKKPWQEAIATALEEPSRRLPPNDGLVALLYPSAAAKMAMERPHDAAAVAAAERECARLVWDEDSSNYFLVHPAVATPFCVTIERSPAWSRTEYAIEHIESPQHLGRLTRDGTGEGWLELDTLVASHIDSHYVLDVAAAALLLVAHLDEKNVLVEQFAPPPAAHLKDPSANQSLEVFRRSSSLLSSKILGAGKEKEKKKQKKRRQYPDAIDFEMGSQTSTLGGKLDVKEAESEKLPGVARTIIKVVGFGFKCVIWILTVAFNAAMAIIVALSKCITSDKP
ncbi:hypothetical protein GGR50DRAFT_456221 [Xylaria sp. CBS 124048]|nr:hypothetical protein GGR50DRAFT_456221 [Xylaria sp. CBS 124048]